MQARREITPGQAADRWWDQVLGPEHKEAKGRCPDRACWNET